MNYKVLSYQQPWGYLVAAGIKDIENRTWKLPEKHKGEWILIHTSGSHGRKFKINLTDDQMIAAFGSIANEAISGRFDFGAIIGAVKFSDCVINHPSIWAEKTTSIPSDVYDISNGMPAYLGKGHDDIIYNWVISEAILFDKPILDVKGKLSFWDFDLTEEYCKLLK